MQEKHDENENFQVKSILTGGPAAADGILRPGDVIVRVNDSLLLGATQSDACQVNKYCDIHKLFSGDRLSL